VVPYRGILSRLREGIQIWRNRTEMSYRRMPRRVRQLEEICDGHLDDIDELKDEISCRVYYQNVETTKIGINIEDTEYAARVINNLEIDVMGLLEVNKIFEHPVVTKWGTGEPEG